MRLKSLLQRGAAFIGFTRRTRLTRKSHIVAHTCICTALLCTWLLPQHFPDAPPVNAPSPSHTINEDEIDDALQRAAVKSLGNREGSIIVMDAQTGRLRALVNSRLAFEEATVPGSTVKPFTTLAALRAGIIEEDHRVFCRGHYKREDFDIACTHARSQSSLSTAQALAYSCNYFFAGIGEQLGGETFKQTLASFGFGTRTRGGDEREAGGRLPPARRSARHALGESRELLATPAQLITAYAALFNGGHLYVPRRAPSQNFLREERTRPGIAPAERALLLNGLRGAVAYGTAVEAGLDSLPSYVFGKTGTSTHDDDVRAQGWFVGLAADKRSSREKASPESIGLAVLVLLKRSRGAECAETARPIFEEYERIAQRSQPELGASRDQAHEPGEASHARRNGGSQVIVRIGREDRTIKLSLDDYVFGVLSGEAALEDELEALKAQAVVSRTYALKNLRRHARDGYDFCSSTHCQRFIPVTDESLRPEFYELLHRTVRETTGEILRDRQGRIAESYFSASCGGATADLASLWGVSPAPSHLRGGRDEFCAGDPYRSWTDVVSAADLLRALRADARSDVGRRLDRVRVVRRDAGGRAALVALEGERHRLLRGWDFKIIVGRTLGWKVVKSSRFDVTRAGMNFVFRGSGFGHGLGLCQSGAHVLARRGAGYRQILERYLPGTNTGREAGENHDRTSENPSRSTAQPARMLPDVFPHTYDDPDTPVAFNYTVRPAARAAPRLTLAGEHVRASYPARIARREVEAAIRTLERVRADVLRRLSAASIRAANPPRVELFIHDTTGDFTGATGRPVWVAAVTNGSRIESQPLDVLRRRGVLDTTLRHEYVHVVIEALGGGRTPRWLAEGLAIHVAGEGASLARFSERNKLSPEELERRLARPASAQEMRALYAAAYGQVRKLINRESEAGVWRRIARR